MDLITYALCKKYIKDSLAGQGFLKGDKGDKGDAFTFKDFTPAQLESLKGEQGLSAYEIAVQQGYEGDEASWVNSLKAVDGLSAYDLAVLDGFSGTKKDWLNSLTGADGKSAFAVAAENGFTGTIDEWLLSLKGNNGQSAYDIAIETGFKGTPEEWIASLKGDTYTLTEDDYNAIADKVQIPTKLSDFENDTKFITADEVPDECKVNDVLVNGVSVVKNKIANIDILSGTIGRTFTTNVTVGHLEAGTLIHSSTSIADILYQILYTDEIIKNGIDMYFGGSENPEAGLVGLDHMTQDLGVEPDILLAAPYRVNIKTGNVETEDGQYPTIITTKALRLVKLAQWQVDGAGALECAFKTIEKNDYFIYYIDTLGYTEDEGGIDYVLTFEEVK